MPQTHLRTEYELGTLEESHAGADPLALFGAWFEAAVQSGEREPNAMTLATVDAQGQPSARIVLCKSFDADGFVFYTNTASRKGRDLAHNPRASLLFFWTQLERQVRIEGQVAAVSPGEADSYFAQRPRAARIGAWASPQSQVLAGREALEQAYAEAEARFAGQAAPPRPAHWGGYRLAAHAMEFWQGRPSRLHDRLLFRRAAGSGTGGNWSRQRLAP
jgi:pyridoxamine 5'-phosphate oxidase